MLDFITRTRSIISSEELPSGEAVTPGGSILTQGIKDPEGIFFCWNLVKKLIYYPLELLNCLEVIDNIHTIPLDFFSSFCKQHIFR